MDKEILYTTGELADIAGITYKSIRIYVEKDSSPQIKSQNLVTNYFQEKV